MAPRTSRSKKSPGSPKDLLKLILFLIIFVPVVIYHYVLKPAYEALSTAVGNFVSSLQNTWVSTVNFFVSNSLTIILSLVSIGVFIFLIYSKDAISRKIENMKIKTMDEVENIVKKELKEDKNVKILGIPTSETTNSDKRGRKGFHFVVETDKGYYDELRTKKGKRKLRKLLEGSELKQRNLEPKVEVKE